MTRFWHPVADMHAVAASGELIFDRAEGCHWSVLGQPLADDPTLPDRAVDAVD